MARVSVFCSSFSLNNVFACVTTRRRRTAEWQSLWLVGVISFLASIHWLHVSFAVAQSETEKIEVRFGELDQTKIVRAGLPDLCLPAGKECLIELSLVNQSANILRFDTVKSNCNCSRPEVSRAEFMPNEATKLRLIWKVPTSSENGISTTSLTFTNGSDVVLELIVFCRLSGSVYLGQSGIGERLDDKFVTWVFPLTWTAPFSKENLTVVTDDALSDFMTEIVPIEPRPEEVSTVGFGRGLLRFTVPRSVMEGRGDIFGVFKIKSSEGNFVLERSTTFSARPLMKVSPSIVRFRSTPENADVIGASLLVQLERQFFPEDRREEITFEASFDGQAIDLVPRHIGNGVYRISVKMPSSFTAKPDGSEFVLRAVLGERSSRFTGNCLID